MEVPEGDLGHVLGRGSTNEQKPQGCNHTYKQQMCDF